MTIGQKVKALRITRGMNQKQLAEISKITQATISRIESGKIRQVKSEDLKSLTNALSTNADYLIGLWD